MSSRRAWLPVYDDLGDPDQWVQSLRGTNWLLKNPSRDQVNAAKESGIVWLTWRVGDSGVPVDHVQQEAIELLALLAHIAYDEFTSLLQHLWPRASKIWLRIMHGKRLRLGVEVVTSDPGNFIQVCERFFEKDIALHASHEFVDRRLQFEDEVEARESSSKRTTVPVRLKIQNRLAANVLRKLWGELRLLVNLQAARDNERKSANGQNPPRAIFRVTEVDVTAARKLFEVEDILRAGEIAASGVLMYPLSVNGSIREGKTAHKYVPMLNRLLGACDAIDGFQPANILEIQLNDDFEDVNGYFLALLGNRSIKEVRFRGRWGVHNTTRAWMWLGAVVFNHIARNAIETIQIDCRAMSSEGVDAMRRTVMSPDPLQVLYPGGNFDEVLDEVVAASQFEITDGIVDWFWTVDFPSQLKNLRVLSRHGSRSRVLLPGWGVGSVKDVTPAPLITPPHHPVTSRPTRQVVFKHMTADRESMVIAFCSAVGTYLRKITLFKSDSSASSMRAILQSCPHLEELVLMEVSLDSLESIADRFEAGYCRVNTLVIDIDFIADKTDAHQFFHRLADARHPMAKHLRVLHFNFKSGGHTIAHVKSSVLRMLQLNRRIYEFHLNVRPWDPEPVASDLVENIPQTEFDRCDGQLVEEPLTLNKMVAFLSVVDSYSATTSSSTEQKASAVHTLDASVVSTIFQFAGGYRERWVRVRF